MTTTDLTGRHHASIANVAISVLWGTRSRANRMGGRCTEASVDRPCSPRCRSSHSSPSPRAATTTTTPPAPRAVAGTDAVAATTEAEPGPRTSTEPTSTEPDATTTSSGGAGDDRRRSSGCRRSRRPAPASTTSRTRASRSRAAPSCSASRPTPPTAGRRTAPASRRAGYVLLTAVSDPLFAVTDDGEIVPLLVESVEPQRRLHRVDAAHPRRHQVPRRHAARRRGRQVQHRRLPSTRR